jgi:hypothetical protein|tara:strand:+ start:3815 stop:3949 length:135 start_codon:yes stop_codon:yes gene_type:complete
LSYRVRLAALFQEIEAEQPQVAEALRGLARDYQYDEILRLVRRD